MRVARKPTLELWLAPHVRACRSEDQVILLDLRRDKYLGIGGNPMRALAGAVGDWPRGAATDDVSATSVDLDALTRTLVEQGLLTDKPSAERRLPAVSLPEAVASLDDGDPAFRVSTGPRRVFRFLRSVATAAAELRWRPLLSTAHAVARRRTRRALGAESVALDAARDAVAAYAALRPLLFTSRDQCLFDSLALTNFLAYEGLFPRWVIGVRTGPFGAHAWVQSGGTVLNDLHEYVRRFTPILVV